MTLNVTLPYNLEHKRDNFESHNSLKLRFTNIWGLCSNFVEYESFLESNSPDILTLHETNLDNSTDSDNFFVKGYLHLIQKDSVTHMHGLAVYVKEDLPFAQDLSLENSADSHLCLWLDLLHSMSFFFFLYRSPSSSLCAVVDTILFNIDEVLSINPSANVFIFRDSNTHHMRFFRKSKKREKRAKYLKILAKMCKICKYFEKRQVIVCDYCTQ